MVSSERRCQMRHVVNFFFYVVMFFVTLAGVLRGIISEGTRAVLRQR